jgi:hypothetical protein
MASLFGASVVMGKVILRESFGLSPRVEVCRFCGRDIEVVRFGNIRVDQGVPRRVCMGREPCGTCKEYMRRGIILVSVKDEDLGKDNPYRTGGWVVVTEEYIRRVLLSDSLAEGILAARFSFVPDSVWDGLKIPRTMEDYEKL